MSEVKMPFNCTTRAPETRELFAFVGSRNDLHALRAAMDYSPVFCPDPPEYPAVFAIIAPLDLSKGASAYWITPGYINELANDIAMHTAAGVLWRYWMR